MKFFFSFLIIFISIKFLPLAKAEQIDIVVSVPYLKDILQNITCSSTEYKITSLIPIGVDPHTFILSPNDRIHLKNADIILQIGAGLEPWLDKIKFDDKQKRIVLSQHVKLHKILNSEGKNNNELIYDPHIWQSPKLTTDSVNLLEKYFAEITPKEKNNIEFCSKKYKEKIIATVNKLNNELSIVPPEKRILATNHDSLGYFADTFGFKIYSIIGLSDEDVPSLKQIKHIITVVQQQHIKALFLDATGNTKNIKTIAQNTHVQIGGKLYSDSFGESGSGAETTLGIWETNMKTLISALK